ncbi:MAG: hypothetical protein AAB354_06730 [candidate division KSB1 bacterium]
MRSHPSLFKQMCWLGLIVLVGMLDNSFAQPRGRGFMPDSAQITAIVDTMALKLTLSKEQKEKFGKIYFASFEEAKKAFEQNRGDFQTMRETRTRINEKRDGEVKALLNDEQKKLYDKIIAEQQEQMRKRMQERGWRN